MSSLQGHYSRTGVYSNVDASRPKYLFQVIGDRLDGVLASRSNPSLLDVGGASGALAGYLKSRFPSVAVTSLDFDPELCRIGASRFPAVNFVNGDANDIGMLGDASFDAVTMVGTLSVFDRFEPALGECLRLVRQGGRVIVAGQFNSHPVDALIRYRYSGEEQWNSGYNLFSHKSIGEFLDRQDKVVGYRFDPFELPFDLLPQDDPIRSWTVRTEDGGREFRNGINLVIDLQILEIVL